MYDLDFLPVGEGDRSGDAIAARFTHPVTGSYVHIVIDAGFEKSGEALVGHVKHHYGTDVVDLAVLSHPDGDHIGGMAKSSAAYVWAGSACTAWPATAARACARRPRSTS